MARGNDQGKKISDHDEVGQREKEEEGHEFVRRRLVVRNSLREFPRDELCAEMRPIEAKYALFAYVARTRRGKRNRGEPEVKLMFVDVKKAHVNARCDEEEWVAAGGIQSSWKRRQMEVVHVRREKEGGTNTRENGCLTGTGKAERR